ncbi:hypothetical protein GEV33_015424 [Tenebrio molitor]|uniref:Uncharacterized protein n=1 Tax=Tenebrio molitor TaxID=7067 RepID=A0A8J6L5W2_TENMO|nr:hypothetical protein GEV33_015424 [Tenebrio molitor]
MTGPDLFGEVSAGLKTQSGIRKDLETARNFGQKLHVCEHEYGLQYESIDEYCNKLSRSPTAPIIRGLVIAANLAPVKTSRKRPGINPDSKTPRPKYSPLSTAALVRSQLPKGQHRLANSILATESKPKTWIDLGNLQLNVEPVAVTLARSLTGKEDETGRDALPELAVRLVNMPDGQHDR